MFLSQTENGQEEWQAIFSPGNFYKTNSLGSDTWGSHGPEGEDGPNDVNIYQDVWSHILENSDI